MILPPGPSSQNRAWLPGVLDISEYITDCIMVLSLEHLHAELRI